jgi:hypothetical protein
MAICVVILLLLLLLLLLLQMTVTLQVLTLHISQFVEIRSGDSAAEKKRRQTDRQTER